MALEFMTKRSEYKGHPLLTLTSGKDDPYPFSFGYQRAKRIMACIKQIEQFVAECEVQERMKRVKFMNREATR